VLPHPDYFSGLIPFKFNFFPEGFIFAQTAERIALDMFQQCQALSRVFRRQPENSQLTLPGKDSRLSPPGLRIVMTRVGFKVDHRFFLFGLVRGPLQDILLKIIVCFNVAKC